MNESALIPDSIEILSSRISTHSADHRRSGLIVAFRVPNVADSANIRCRFYRAAAVAKL